MTDAKAKGGARGARGGGARPAAVSAHDLGLVVGLPLVALSALLVPERRWHSLARRVAPHASGIISRGGEEIARTLAAVLGDRSVPSSPEEVARELVEHEIVRNFHTVRDHLPGRWRPDVALAGEEHLRAALDRGKGAIVWDSHFYYANLMTKMALHRAGYRLCHLSHPRHGFSTTRFGMRVLNPIRWGSEVHYLAERVVLSVDGPIAAMRTLLKRLKKNTLVSMTVLDTGHDPCVVPFMDGALRAATGAPDLAFASGAALLPVFTVLEADGRYVAKVEPPIGLPAGAGRREAAEAAVAEYAARLERHVLEYPGQWVGWINI